MTDACYSLLHEMSNDFSANTINLHFYATCWHFSLFVTDLKKIGHMLFIRASSLNCNANRMHIMENTNSQWNVQKEEQNKNKDRRKGQNSGMKANTNAKLSKLEYLFWLSSFVMQGD